MDTRDDESFCRVCHLGSQPDNPLFYPCKCDGSIKYVHQDCLLEWLKYSKQTNPKCELCGEHFHFKNVYKVNTPTLLTIFDITIEVIPRLLKVFKFLINVLIAITLWGILLPLFTNYWFHLCWCFSTEKSIEKCSNYLDITNYIDSFDHFITSWYSGIVNICIIIAVSVVFFEIGQLIYKEYEIADKFRRIKMLEKQVIQATTALQKLEDNKRERDFLMFAVADFESLKDNWEYAKQDFVKKLTIIQTMDDNTGRSNNGDSNNYRSSQSNSCSDSNGTKKSIDADNNVNFDVVDNHSDKDNDKRIVSKFHQTNDVVGELVSGRIDQSSTIDGMNIRDLTIACLELDLKYTNRIIIKIQELGSSPELENFLQLLGKYEKFKIVVEYQLNLARNINDINDYINLIKDVDSNSADSTSAISTDAADNPRKLVDEEIYETFNLAKPDARIISSATTNYIGRDRSVESIESMEKTMLLLEEMLQTQQANLSFEQFSALNNKMNVLKSYVENVKANQKALDEEETKSLVLVDEIDKDNLEYKARLLMQKYYDEQAQKEKNFNSHVTSNTNECSKISGVDHADVSNMEVKMSAVELNEVTENNEVSPDGDSMQKRKRGVSSTDNVFDYDWKMEDRSIISDMEATKAESDEVSIRLNSEEGISSNNGHELVQRNTLIDTPDRGELVSDTTDNLEAEALNNNLDIMDTVEIIEGFGTDGLEAQANRTVDANLATVDDHDTAGAAGDNNLDTGNNLLDNEPRENNVVVAAGAERANNQIVNRAEDIQQQLARLRQENPRGVGDGPIVVHLGYKHLAWCFLYVALFIFAFIVIPAEIGRLVFDSTIVSEFWKEKAKKSIATVLENEGNMVLATQLLEELSNTLQNNGYDEAAKVEISELFYSKFKTLVEIGMGYSLFVAVAMITYVSYCIRNLATGDYGISVVEFYSAQVRLLYDGFNSSIKITLVIAMYGIILPLIVALLLVKASLRIVPNSIREQLLDYDALQLIYGLAVYLISHILVAHLVTILYEIRQAIRADLLRDFLPKSIVFDQREEEQELGNNFFGLHELFLKVSFSQLLKKFLLNVIVIIPGVVVSIVLPIRFGHLFVPFSSPLQLKFKSVVVDVQIPVEMILSHILIPLIIEKIKYRECLHFIINKYLKTFAPLFNMDEILSESLHEERGNVAEVNAPVVDVIPTIEDQRDGEEINTDVAEIRYEELGKKSIFVQIQSLFMRYSTTVLNYINTQNHEVRGFILASVGLLLMTILSSWVLHIPLIVGRKSLQTVGIPPTNDIFNYPVGITISWAISKVGVYLLKDLVNNRNTIRSIIKAIQKWTILTVEVVVIGIVWLIVPPILIGYLLTASILVPMRASLNETPQYPFVQCWAIGLILLKVWMR